MFSDLLPTIWGNFADYVFGAALCTMAELIIAGEKQSLASRFRGVVFTALSLAAAVLGTRNRGRCGNICFRRIPALPMSEQTDLW